MVGAEINGTRISFSTAKWLIKDCGDWTKDTRFLEENPESAKHYEDELRLNGKLCVLCFWCDEVLCVHQKAHDQREREEEAAGRLEAEALDRFQRDKEENDKAFWESG